MVDVTTSSANLITIYNSQRDNSFAIINGQSESDVPTQIKDTIHVVFSFKRNTSFGYQFILVSNRYFIRSKQNGTWSSWNMFTFST